MTQYFSNIRTWAALLIAGAAFAACSSDDNVIEEPQQPAEAKTYTLTVLATKGDDAADSRTTRALSLDGKTLNATWAEGEEVTVYNETKKAALTGSLTAQSSGASTTLKGSLTGTIENGDQLKLKFLSPSYSTQNGTLAYIAANCDYAEATVTVTDTSTPSVTTTAASFTNQQAIIKFSLKHKVTNAAVNISTMTVSVGTNTYTVTPSSATDVLYVALPGFSNKTVTLTAASGGYNFDFERDGITFNNGQYYEIAVKMKERILYDPPTPCTGLTFNGTPNKISGSAQDLVNPGGVNYGTIYYSTNGGSSWSTSIPTATNAGTYTVHYKIVPAEGYSGGVGSTSLGGITIAKRNGWCELSPTSSSGWGTISRFDVKIESFTVTHHGGDLSYVKGGSSQDNISVAPNGNSYTITCTYKNKISSAVTITVTSAATTNYKAASATYTCNL